MSLPHTATPTLLFCISSPLAFCHTTSTTFLRGSIIWHQSPVHQQWGRNLQSLHILQFYFSCIIKHLSMNGQTLMCCINGYCCYCRLNHKSPDSSSMNELFVGPTTFWRFLSTLEHLYNDKAVCRTKTVNRLKYVLGGHVISSQTHNKRV